MEFDGGPGRLIREGSKIKLSREIQFGILGYPDTPKFEFAKGGLQMDPLLLRTPPKTIRATDGTRLDGKDLGLDKTKTEYGSRL